MSDPARFETYQRSEASSAEITSGRLADKARRLLESSMADTGAGRKHKWATGREKWEALQREGQIAAGVAPQQGRGRPRKSAPTPGQLLEDFLERLANHQGFKLSGQYTEDQLSGDKDDLLDRMALVKAAGALSDEVLQLAVATLGE